MLNSFIAEILLLGSVACYAATARPTITGKVVDANGKPLADTTVMVYHAGVRMGYSTFCPSCYADCGKRVLTATNGSFQIADLSPDLWFELLAVRDGYMPQFEHRVDPAKSTNVTIVLSTRPVTTDWPVTTDFSGVVRGRVVDADGSPIRNAIVHSIGIIVEKTESAYGSLDGLEPVAVTNGNGNFEISYAKPTPKMLLNIEARAMAPSFVTLDTGPERHIVVLHDGAAITGRLMVDGKPVGNAEIGLIAKNRGGFGGNLTMTGEPYDEVRIGTRADGSFTITNVPEPVDWYLYAKMNSVNQRGATAPVEVQTSQDKEYVHAPDLIIRPGYPAEGYRPPER